MSDSAGSGDEAAHAQSSDLASAHVPVLCDAVVTTLSPKADGCYLDGTFGAGGYTRALLDAGAGRVLGVDRDPTALAAAAEWAGATAGRLTLHRSRFSALDAVAEDALGAGPTLDGVALDLGVSSMQLDQPARGFSFLRDGPLDMRMDQAADSADETAAALIARLDEAALADLLYLFGEERASRRIARAILEARDRDPIETTGRLAEIVAGCLPRPKPGQAHPATRSFQALRIAVNGELDELVAGLSAAERALRPGGVLAVVTFHSLEDRIVKRFFRLRAGRMPRGSRYEPELNASEDRIAPGFASDSLSEVAPGEAEIAANPRARSARLRAATRSAAAAEIVDGAALGLPQATRSPRRRPGKRPAARGGKGGSRGGDRRR